MRGDQLARQWRILRHIEASQGGLSVSELVEMEGAHKRTVYRDLAALQDAGFPLYNEKAEGGVRWAFVDGYRFRVPEPFTMTELLSLYLYSDFTKMFSDTFFHESLASVFKKVRATLTPANLAFVDRVKSSFAVGIKPYKDYGRFREMMKQASQAAMERRRIEIAYHALNSDKETIRKVEPYKVWFFDGTIYLIGRCLLRGEVRTFVLDRIRMLRPTRETFELPEGFSLDGYLKNSFRVMRDELHTVKVRISAAWSRWAGERIWHESQQARKLSDGGLELTFHVAGLDEIRLWVLSLGPEAEAIEPPELRRAVVASLNRTLDAYMDRTGTDSQRMGG